MSPNRLLKTTTDVRETDRNIGLCLVRPADVLSAALVSTGFKTRWAHRLQVYVPKGLMLQQSARAQTDS